MFDKHVLAKEIGNFFGTYFEENGQFCIDNYDSVFRYDTVDALLIDWVNSLIENQYDNEDLAGYWDKEVEFIYTQVIGKLPDGIQALSNQGSGHSWDVSRDVSWDVSFDLKEPMALSARNLHLGVYASLVDALVARNDFEMRVKCLPSNGIEFWVNEAKQMQLRAKGTANDVSPVVQNLIAAMVAYGAESCWTDREVYDALTECGLHYNDFQKAGYGAFARKLIQEDRGVIDSDTLVSSVDALQLSADALEGDPYLFTCIADKEFKFLVHGMNAEDAERFGLSWYEKTCFEPGHFFCDRFEPEDLKSLSHQEILETKDYLKSVKQNSNSKKPLSQQIMSAENKSALQGSSLTTEKEVQR